MIIPSILLWLRHTYNGNIARRIRCRNSLHPRAYATGYLRGIKEKLESADVIDVTGGDVNYLLDWAKKSKLDTYLQNLLDKDVVYVGTSAGDGLLIPDIGLTWWEPGMSADHNGLGIVDFIIVPHQKESDISTNEENLIKRKKYLQSVIDFPWQVYLLQDEQAIKVVGGNVEHIGLGCKRIV